MQSTKNLQQTGTCQEESCTEPAFSKRHTFTLELYWVDGQLHSRDIPREIGMCVRHKAKYLLHMDKLKKELEAKRRVHV